MTTYELVFAAVILAQAGCVADMLVRGCTLPMPVAGGRATVVNRQTSPIAFFIVLALWIGLFAIIDLLVWR